MDAKVSIVVPVETEGVSAGVKEGGMLQIIRRELEVICKPKDTPDSVKLDITELEIGDGIHVADIDMGSEIEIPFDTNFTVVTIVPPESAEEEEIEEEAEIGEVSEGAQADTEAAAE